MLEFLGDKKYQILNSVDSTNDYIKDKDLFLAIANSQTSGKGTNNRSFYSPSGGIYFSVKLKVKTKNLQLVTPYTAVAVINAIYKVCNLKADIKWVNDIYINGQKLGGILCESVINGEYSTVIIGVGINVKEQEFPSFNLNNPTSLERELKFVPDKNEIVCEIVKNLMNIDKELESRKFLSIYKERSNLIGKIVNIEQGVNKQDGKVVAINDDASILIDVAGELITYHNGDIKIET